jgi:transposase
LASVASDVMGVSARDMLSALLAGTVDPAVLAELARGRMRSKRDLLAQALQGQLKSYHRFLIAEQLVDIDTLDEAIEGMSTEIAERLRPYEHQIQRLSTIPGIKRRLAEVILAEVGPDMVRRISGRERSATNVAGLVGKVHAYPPYPCLTELESRKRGGSGAWWEKAA